jgi:hypothetical protein
VRRSRGREQRKQSKQSDESFQQSLLRVISDE